MVCFVVIDENGTSPFENVCERNHPNVFDWFLANGCNLRPFVDPYNFLHVLKIFEPSFHDSTSIEIKTRLRTLLHSEQSMYPSRYCYKYVDNVCVILYMCM